MRIHSLKSVKRKCVAVVKAQVPHGWKNILMILQKTRPLAHPWE